MKDYNEEDVNLLINAVIKKTIDTHKKFDHSVLENTEKDKDLILELKEYIYLSMYAFHLIEMSNYANYEENTTIH